MKRTGIVWSNLSINEKLLLLEATYPQRSTTLLEFEANRKWNDLLPSTQNELQKVDWSLIVDRKKSQ